MVHGGLLPQLAAFGPGSQRPAELQHWLEDRRRIVFVRAAAMEFWNESGGIGEGEREAAGKSAWRMIDMPPLDRFTTLSDGVETSVTVSRSSLSLFCMNTLAGIHVPKIRPGLDCCTLLPC